MNSLTKYLLLFSLIVFCFTTNIIFAQTIAVQTLSEKPNLDGKSNDWNGVTGFEIPLKNYSPKGKVKIASISVKAGVHGKDVYFLFQWKDKTNDNQHKPYVWDAGKKKYVAGPQSEDRLAIQFEMEGNLDANWFSGNTFKSDTWHWKAFRTNSIGLVHDKMTIIGKDPIKKAFKTQAQDGSTIYIQRPGDQGDKLYKTKRYRKKEKAIMPKYIVNAGAKGSIADVRAKGVWKNGTWTLELKRSMNTGNSDDAVFVSNQSIKSAIAVFDHSGNEDHSVSQTLVMQF